MSAQADGVATMPLSARVADAVDRPIGRVTGETARVIAVTHSTAVIALVAAASYTAFWLTYSPAELMLLVAVNAASVAGYAVVLVLTRLGRQWPATTLLLVTALAQTVAMTALVGRGGGFHVMAVLAGPLAYLTLTERQRRWRAVVLGSALAVISWAQVAAPSVSAPVALPSSLLVAVFTANLLATVGAVAVLAAVFHHRTIVLRAEADRATAQARQVASTDALTGVLTRQASWERLTALSSTASAPFAVAIADVDHVSETNDTYGLECGDRILAAVGSRLREQFRGTDALGRWSADQFILILPEADAVDATVMVARLRDGVAATPVECDGHLHAVSVTVGVADGLGLTPDQTIVRVNRALRRAANGDHAEVSLASHLPGVPPEVSV